MSDTPKTDEVTDIRVDSRGEERETVPAAFAREQERTIIGLKELLKNLGVADAEVAMFLAAIQSAKP